MHGIAEEFYDIFYRIEAPVLAIAPVVAIVDYIQFSRTHSHDRVSFIHLPKLLHKKGIVQIFRKTLGRGKGFSGVLQSIPKF